ncbi:hypothetical protein Tco_0554143 [Tanacetum coccineum]
MRDIVRSKTERELVRVKIHDGNAFWNEIGVNAGVSKLMLLSLNLLLPVLVYAARHSLTAVRHKLMLPGITYYCWKPKESDGFEGMIDFLNASSIRYALTVNPTIYTTCIEQFWATAKVKTVNEECQIQALVDKKKVIITETSIRSDLKLEGAEGTDCLPTATIFAELERMGYENLTQKLTFYKAYFSSQWKFLIHTILQCLSAKTTAWNKFSSTMASAIICLTLFQTLDVQAPKDMGEDSAASTKQFTRKFVSFREMITSQLQGKLWFYDEVRTRFCLFCHHQIGEDWVLALETINISQDTEIVTLKKRVKKLEKKKRSRTHKSKRLYKVGTSRKVESSEESLGDTEVTLVTDTQERNDEEMLFDVHDGLQGDEVVAEKEVSIIDPVPTTSEEVTTANVEVTIVSAPTTTIDELTLAQTLIKIKAAKPKAVTTAATTTITTRPKAKGVVVQELSEFKTTTSSSQAHNFQTQLQAELIKEERLARQKKEEASRAAILEEMDSIQAMIEADEQLAAKLQTEEQEKYSIKEKSRMLVEMIAERKSFFTAQRAAEQRRRSYEEIQMLFDKVYKEVNSFVPMVVEYSNKAKSDTEQESNTKRAGDALEREKAKKQKIDDDQEEEELKNTWK